MKHMSTGHLPLVPLQPKHDDRPTTFAAGDFAWSDQYDAHVLAWREQVGVIEIDERYMGMRLLRLRVKGPSSSE